jgi:hypothetical protein
MDMKVGSWNVNASVWDKFTHGSCKRNINIKVRSSEGTRGQMGQVISNQHMNVYFSMEGGMRIMN